jgi:hypothetical protein
MRHVTLVVEWILCAGAVTRAAALVAGCDGVGSALCRLVLGSCLSLARSLLIRAEATSHGR